MDTAAHPILTTPRLVLRPYRESDFDAAHCYAVLPEVSQFMDWGPNTAEDTRAFLIRCVEAARHPEEQGYLFAVTLRDGDRMIGGCNLSVTDQAQREAMMGYCLHPDVWGQGYTTEAAAALLGMGFEALGLHRVVSWCDPDNVGSWRVMEKLGLRREGHEREAAWFKGRWHDWLRYAILDWEWRARTPETSPEE